MKTKKTNKKTNKKISNNCIHDGNNISNVQNVRVVRGKFLCYLLTLIALCSLLFVSCSSAPKNPGDIDILRSQAETWLESGNKESGQGNFENALLILTETKRYAILADDLSLIIRVSLSRGNVLFSLGRDDEAFAEWQQAVSEAELLGNRELLSVSRIYLARGNMISLKASPQSVLDLVIRESANIKSNRLYIAFAWQVRGLTQGSLGLFRDAEESFRKSLAIHLKDKNFENASFDWFSIASIRSLSGNNAQGAIEALEASIALDRRIENSWGLASSYRAMGDVLRKIGREAEAIVAYSRARTIFAAMGNEQGVAEINERIGN
ncbi:MAG: tetratricopeptide repeat protein [Treponema sp.]|jgi:tetratricopeptide (TPR) repeat protein|nr:tetratricopeptide repeat protein [Treponema sp.]